MPSPIIVVNGVDIRSIGIYPTKIPGFENSPSRRVVTAESPYEYGSHVVQVEGGGARDFVIEGAIKANSVTARMALAGRAKMLFSQGLNHFEVDWGGGYGVVDGLLDGVPIFRTERAWRHVVTLMELRFKCPVPFWQSPYGIVISNSGTAPVALPLSSGPVAIMFRVHGTGAVVSLRVMDAWGLVRHDIAFASLATTEFAEIDNRVRRGIEKVASGTRSSIISLCTITGKFPFAIDHTYGDVDNSLFPRFFATVGVAEAYYRWTWL